MWRGPRPINRSFVIDRLLRYLFIFPLGLQGLWAFVGHTVFSEDAAREIGWADTPFQYEVGVANLGLAFASLYAAFRGFEARMAAALAAGCFLAGAGVFHIRDIALTGNLAPGNAGAIMITDFSHTDCGFCSAVLVDRGVAAEIAGHARTRGRAQGRALSKISARTERSLAQIYFAGAASAISAMTGR